MTSYNYGSPTLYLCQINGIPDKKAPPIGGGFLIGGLSYPDFSPKAKIFQDFALKMMIFLIEIASEQCKTSIFFRLRRATTRK